MKLHTFRTTSAGDGPFKTATEKSKYNKERKKKKEKTSCQPNLSYADRRGPKLVKDATEAGKSLTATLSLQNHVF